MSYICNVLGTCFKIWKKNPKEQALKQMVQQILTD